MAAKCKDRTKNDKICTKSTKKEAKKKTKKCVKLTRKSFVLVNHCKKSKKKVKKKNYSPESLANALKALDTGISIRKAAAAYGIPPATLGRQKRYPGKFKKKSGPGTVLSKNFEEEIVNWILYKAERGQPVSKTELLDSIQYYVKIKGVETPFVDNRPGRHWFEGFRKRHPSLSIRKPQHLSVSRASVTQEDLQGWFEEVKEYLQKKDLLDSERVLTYKGTRAAYKVTDGGKECLTVLFMHSADGMQGPPMLMFKYKESVPKKIAEKTPTDWGIGIPESGWLNSETFFEYMTNVFYPWLLKSKVQFPVIVYLDNHSSHMTIPLVSFCRDKQIELIGLYPNCTHIMQPLDIAFFRPFKESWKKTVPKWKMQNDVMKMKKEDFPGVLKMALENMSNEKEVVVSGFRASGLLPFNATAVDYNIFNKKQKTNSENLIQTQSQQDVMSNINGEQHLTYFESRLSTETLEDFKSSLIGANPDQWNGDIEKKDLYMYYRMCREDVIGIDVRTDNVDKGISF